MSTINFSIFVPHCKNIYFYLKYRFTDRFAETEGESFYPLVNFPIDHNNWS